MLQYKTLCLLLTTTQTSRRLCLLLEGCPKKSFSVVVSWRSSFHRKNRPAEKSFSVVGQQQTERLVFRLQKLGKISKFSAIFTQIFERWEGCKGVHCVDLGERFPKSIYLQNLPSIQPRTGLSKFAKMSRKMRKF